LVHFIIPRCDQRRALLAARQSRDLFLSGLPEKLIFAAEDEPQALKRGWF